MADIAAIAIKNVEGSMLSEDKSHALVGLVLANDEKIALAVSHEILQRVINSFVDALGAFAAAKMDTSPKISLNPTWFEAGWAEGSHDVALTFRMPNGGSMTYALDRSMAEQLQQTLTVMVGQGDMSPQPGTSKQ